MAYQVLALSGSQQGLDLAAKRLIDDGTPIVTESPTYLAALQVFELFGARILPLSLDANVLDPAALDTLLCDSHPACVYLIPSFQNPSCYCYSDDMRRAIAKVLDKHDAVLIEDGPYRSVALDVSKPLNTMRLNYSLATPEQMNRGLAILADCITAGSAG